MVNSKDLKKGDFVRNINSGDWIDNKHISRDKFPIGKTWEVLNDYRGDSHFSLRNLTNGRTYDGMSKRSFERI